MQSHRIFGQKRTFSKFLSISPKIREALNNGEGVVALESTVISHGLPFPHNLETARQLESQVKLSGSHPATIALLDGKIHVGLDDEKLELIASSSNAVKVSTRDIAKTLVRKQLGVTTVASTMKIAHAAGIHVFATGGIGGVHRGADQTFDISADLQELSQTPVCVVCSGVKSILDIPKTVEYLETHSVNCIVYGEENIFPSFFTRNSTSKAQFNTTDFDEIARLLEVSKSLGLPAGTVLACPIPSEFAADGDVIQKAINQALREANEQNIASQKVTPFILARVNELTKGASMKTNIALLNNNAKIAGILAQKLSKRPVENFKTSAITTTKKCSNKPTVVSIGATIVDFEAITTEEIKEDGGSYAGKIVQRMGGVARNHADAVARLGCESIFISAVGTDPNADFFRQECKHINISRVTSVENAPTCTYLSMNYCGNVKYGISTCEPLLQMITPKLIEENIDVIKTADYILLDSNMPVPVIKKVLEISQKYDRNIWFEPTDIQKVGKVFDAGHVEAIAATSPNANEFLRWAKLCNVNVPENCISDRNRLLEIIDKERNKLMKNMQILVVSLADNGTIVVERKNNNQFDFHSLDCPVDPKAVVSVSGAGDSFNSGVIAGLVHKKPFSDCLKIGQKCASLTLQTTEAVSHSIIPAILH